MNMRFRNIFSTCTADIGWSVRRINKLAGSVTPEGYIANVGEPANVTIAAYAPQQGGAPGEAMLLAGDAALVSLHDGNLAISLQVSATIMTFSKGVRHPGLEWQRPIGCPTIGGQRRSSQLVLAAAA